MHGFALWLKATRKPPLTLAKAIPKVSYKAETSENARNGSGETRNALKIQKPI